ncbi:MAG: alpha/beta fold hydrolase [Oscillospiraceae bacterium]|nr:alpha/beta fold hydrolase [Oscillospiraceae bacterium]
MKKLLAFLLAIVLTLAIGGCIPTGNADVSDEPSPESIDWEFYTQRAETFITAIASDDIETAFNLLEAIMKQHFPSSSLKTDLWDLIIGQVGDFIAIYDISTEYSAGYYMCRVTTYHENIGVIFRLVFTEDGLITGLFIDDYPILSDAPPLSEKPTDFSLQNNELKEITQREGFTDYPVVIGEESDYPLHGILSIPDGYDEMLPAVVLVHGSGAHDMDSTIYENKPFKDIADYLAANGIAVIRYNKRNYAYEDQMAEVISGEYTVYHETVEDAILASNLLKAHPLIDENRVYIIGLSMGAYLAPRIHSDGGDFAGLILLAGSPYSIHDAMRNQQILLFETIMEDGEEKDAILAQLTKEAYDAAVAELYELPDEIAKQTSIDGGAWTVYFFKEWDAIPTSEYVENITVPFLIMQGSEDFQVLADINYVAWQELLAGRDNVTFKLYEGLNHLFMQSQGKNITEIEEEYSVPANVNTQVLEDITQWIYSN